MGDMERTVVGGAPADAGGDDVEIRDYRADDHDQVLELLRLCFGQWPRALPTADQAGFFAWKHSASPFGRSRMLVAADGGRVVGFWALMTWRLAAGEATFLTTRSGDLAVHPDYRRLKLSMRMRAAATFPDDHALLWSESNTVGRTGALKAGAERVGEIPRYVLPLPRLRRALSAARHAGTPDRPEAQPAAELLARDIELPAEPPSPQLRTARDLDYLRWRYGRLDDYRAVVAEDTSRGLAIFRVRDGGRARVLEICELLVSDYGKGTARELLRGITAAASGVADVLVCNFASQRQAARHGFVRYGGAVLNVRPLNARISPDPTQRDSWRLTRGDLELL